MKHLKYLKRIVGVVSLLSGTFAAFGQGPVLIPNVVSTVAGNALAPTVAGFKGDGGLATAATLNVPETVVVDADGNLYIADTQNDVIREVNAQTGIITTVAGKAPVAGCLGTACYPATFTYADGGLATQTQFVLSTTSGSTPNSFASMAIDALGNLYIVDSPPSASSPSGTLRVVYKAGAGVAAMIKNLDPTGVAATGGVALPGYVYGIVNPGGAASGNPLTTAQAPSVARFNAMTGVALDALGNIYVADGHNNIRVINTQPTSMTFFGASVPAGMIEVVVGNAANLANDDIGQINDMPVTTDTIEHPRSIYVDAGGDLFYIANGSASFNSATVAYAGGATAKSLISALYPSATPTVNTQYVVAGNAASPFPSTNAFTGFSDPTGITVDAAGNVYIADSGSSGTYRVDAITGSMTVITGGKTLTTVGAKCGTTIFTATDTIGDGCTQGQVDAYPMGVALDSIGNLYLADRTNNTVRKASLGTQFAAISVGSAAVQQVLRMKFYKTNFPAAANPFRVVSGTAEFSLVGTPACGAALTDGSEDCLVTVSFSPVGAGPRSALLQATDAAGVTHMFGLTGIGLAPQAAIDSPANTVVGAGLSAPGGVAVDSAGNTYVADTGNNRVVEFAAGSSTPVVLLSASQVKSPAGVAVDAAGNVYIADTGNNRVLSLAPGGTPAVLPGTYSAPQGVAVDRQGNVYVADTGNARVVLVPAPGVLASMAPKAFATGSVTLSKPIGMAVDSAGNVWVADAGLNQVVELAYSDLASAVGGKATFGQAFGTGFAQVGGVAVDAGGTVYVSDTGGGTIAELSGLPSSPVQTNYPTVSGIAKPAGLALDPSGNLYVANMGGNNVVELNRSNAAVVFPPQLAGGPGATQTLNLLDIGNQPLQLSALNVTGTGYSQIATGFTDCGSTTKLAGGGECALGLSFNPAPGVQGTVTGSVVATDNALNQPTATQMVSLTTNVTCTCTAQTIGFTLSSPVVYGVAPITLTATASSGLPVSYTVSGPATVANGVLTITGAGTVTVTATQGGNSTYAPATSVARTLTVNPAVLTVTAANLSRGTNVPNPSTFGYSITGFAYSDTAATAVTGQPSITTSAQTNSPAGTYPIVPALGTLAAANYTFAFVNGTLTIQGTGQTITFNPLPTVTYGVAPITLSGTATSGLAVSYTVLSGPATVAGNVLTVTGSGTVVVQANQPGNYANGAGFGAAIAVTQSFTVNRATLTLTIQSLSRTYGAPNPTLTGTFTGVVNNDPLTATYSTTATTLSPVGSYPITATLSGPNASSYIFSSSTAALTVTIAPTTTTLSASSLQVAMTGSITLTANVLTTLGGTPAQGTVTFVLNGSAVVPNGAMSAAIALSATGTATLTLQGVSLASGQNLIAAQYGGDTTNTPPNTQASNSNTLTLTEAYSSTTSTVTLSTANANLGQAVTLSATVTTSTANAIPPPATTRPTGTITFYAGSGLFQINLGSAPVLPSGVATLTTTALPAGSTADQVTATYNGDANFFPSSSAGAAAITVTAPAFSLQISNYGVFTFERGGSTTQTLNVLSTGGFNQAVGFACSGLPAGVTCSFSPATVTPDGTGRATPTQMTVSATSTASVRQSPGSFGGVFVAAILFGLGGLFRQRRKGRTVSPAGMGLWIVVAAAGLFGLAGCATGSSMPTGQVGATVTVTAYTGSASNPTATQTTTFVLTVQ
jgi:sugar lactone lactonase YvrE